MARGRAINVEIRNLIVNYHLSGTSGRKIAKDLMLPASTVADIIKKYSSTGSVDIGKSPGRKRLITIRDVRALITIAKENRRSSLRDLSKLWSERIKKCTSTETTRKYLRQNGYKFYKAKEKPFLTKLQKQKRLKWAKERQNWVQRQWDTIIFSDESKFDLCVGDTRKRVIRNKNEAYHKDCLKRTVKFPGSVMVWGCMSSKGVGTLHFVNGIVNAQKYIDILRTSLIPSAETLTGNDEWTFQQDGASSHTAKITKKWLQDSSINVLADWPYSSPDLSPIESIWGILKRKLRSDPQRTIDSLKQKKIRIFGIA